MKYAYDKEAILSATNGGLNIILEYYPQASKVVNTNKPFKIRNESGASSYIKKFGDNYGVTDFGDDAKKRNAIEVCMLEEDLKFADACKFLAKKYSVSTTGGSFHKPIFKTNNATKDQIETGYNIEELEEAPANWLKVVGIEVTNEVCNEYNLKPVKKLWYVKTNKEGKQVKHTKESTPEYPIFAFIYEEWAKVYEPLADKKYRFIYLGKKPKDHVFGMQRLQERFNNNLFSEDDRDYSDEYHNNQIKFKSVFICTGGSDAINLASFGYNVIWKNSETDLITGKEYKQLKSIAHNIYNLPDLDNTGVKQAVKLGDKYLDIKHVWLPNELLQVGKKDFRDYVKVNYTNESMFSSFKYNLNKLIFNAIPFKFWTKKAKSTTYDFNNYFGYKFLELQGFYLYEDVASKDGYVLIKITNNKVKKVNARQIRKYVLDYLEQQGENPQVRNMVMRTPYFSDAHLQNLTPIELDFTNSDKDYQLFFFKNKVVKISAKEPTVQQINYRDLKNIFVWEDAIIDHNFKIESDYFNLTKTPKGNYNALITKKDCNSLNFVINTSRNYWKYELEDFFKNRTDKEAAAYYEANKFQIAGEHLNQDQKDEQMQSFANKMYCLGYLNHTYKNESLARMIFAMDNRISDVGESNGGSGKSLLIKGISFYNKQHFIPGRKPKLAEDQFIYDGVTEATNHVFIDDCNQYTPLSIFYSDVTGDFKVNPKGNTPFTIPFSNSPKFIVTSNHVPTDNSGSTERRLIKMLFSDYYHDNTNKEYHQARRVSDDFNGENLYSDYTPEQWNMHYNMQIQATKFFLQSNNIVECITDNIEKRANLQQMGNAFFDWANDYFILDKTDEQYNPEDSKLDRYFIKDEAIEDYKKSVGKTAKSNTNIKKALQSWCEYYNYNLNPVNKMDSSGTRKNKKVNGKLTQHWFIHTGEETLTDTELDQITNPNTDDLPF